MHCASSLLLVFVLKVTPKSNVPRTQITADESAVPCCVSTVHITRDARVVAVRDCQSSDALGRPYHSEYCVCVQQVRLLQRYRVI